MQNETNSTPDGIFYELDERFVDGAFIDDDLGIVPRTRRSYISKGILPPPDANLQGRDLWKFSTYRKFKTDVQANKFALNKLAHLRTAKSAS